MTYTFIYEPDYSRVMFAVLVDSRASIPAIKNKVGSVIKEYVDGQIEMVDSESIVYRIETELGVIGGFFVIKVNPANKTATLTMPQFRPAFVADSTNLSNLITNFIFNLKTWQSDYLF